MKTIVMYEGGQEHIFTAAKLRTPLQSGGTCDWVPEDETDLVTKYVSENGTYNASSDDAYGYSSVTVNVPGGEGSAKSDGTPAYNPSDPINPGTPPGGIGSAVTGTDPETGEEVVVGVDEGGNIVQTKIPYGIKIVIPPTKTDYNAGDDMDYTGIMVKLTNKNGDTYTDVDHPSGWYVNPADLIFPVEKAPAGSGSGSEKEYSDGNGFNAVKITTSLGTVPNSSFYSPSIQKYFDQDFIAGQIVRVVFPDGSSPSDGAEGDLTYIDSEGESATFYLTKMKIEESGQIRYIWLSTYNHAGMFAMDEHSNWGVAMSSTNWGLASGYGPFYIQSITGGYEATQYYNYSANIPESTRIGSTSELRPTCSATIPVKWTNPYTGETHQDTFEITSTPASGDAHTSTGSNGTEGN